MTHQDDHHYIEQTLAGNTHAFAVLVERYQHLVFTLCIRMLKNHSDAEEIAQDVFVKAFQKLSSFKGDSKFSTWLYRVAYNRCLDALSRKRITTTNAALLHISDHRDNAQIHLEKAEERKQIAHCIGLLKPKDAVLITLYYLEEQSMDEIAKVVGLTSNNVKVKLFRARKKLYDIMSTQLPREIRAIYE